MVSPQISIIVPVFNASEYLLPLMSNFQSQTFQDFEVIFINDCSPDNSAEILSQLVKEDNRVRVFHHEKNRCQGAARNTGLDNAQGEYILYIDADDSIPENYLETLLREIEKYDADLVICNSIWAYPDHEIHRNMFIDNPDLPELLLTGEELLQRYFFIYNNDIRIPVEPWGRIVRRNMIEKYHLRFPNALHEDVVMTFSELLFARKVMLLNDYLYYYNCKNRNCVTLEKKKQYLRDFPEIFNGFRTVLLTNGLYDKHLEWLSRFYFGFLSGVYENFSKKEDLSQEMYDAVLYYRTLFPDPLIDGSERFISDKLINFKLEMERNSLSEIFSLFIEVHPEVHPLLKKNFRIYFISFVNIFMRYSTIQEAFTHMIINPKTEEMRKYVKYLRIIYKKIKN